MINKSNRITTLEHVILRDEGRGKSDTFIYTVPKVNKVKAYCKLGKLEDIMEHFNINSIDQLINTLEAWKVINDRFEYFEMEEGDVFVNKQELFAQTSPFDNNDLKIIKKVAVMKND